MKAEAEVPAPRMDAPAVAAVRLSLRDLVELAKPRLTLLVLFTTVVSFAMAAPPGALDGLLLLNTAIGTALAAAGASALNQLIERRHDAKMQRTAARPLAAGRVGRREALMLGTAVIALGVAQLALLVNALTALLCLLTVGSYVAVYTPLKRTTPLCTLVGAVPGALPVVMGWTAATGRLDLQAWILFAILFAWQLPHFMAIGVIYLEDYARAGFPMRPVLDAAGGRTGAACLPRRSVTGWVAIGWCLALLAASVAPLAAGTASAVYAAGAALLGVGYLAAAVALAVHRTKRSARHLFVASVVYLPLLLGWLALHVAIGQ